MSDIASYLESMGARPSAGAEYVMDCPFCDRRGHLYCNTDESEEWDGKKKPAGRWICFGCNEKSMDFARLMAELDGISFQEARAVMNKWKLGGIRFKRAIEQVIPDSDKWLPDEFESVSQCWPKYLDRRNITRETALRFNLGVCRSGPMAHRIILPIECPMGRSYQARAILKDMEPRYLSGDNSGQLLFGWQTIADEDLAVLVEGPFDALKVAQAGLPSVALMGKQLRDSQAAMLQSRRRRYIVALDPLTKDKTAIDNACDIAQRLNGLVVTSLVTDPGDATESQILHAANDAKSPREVRMMLLELRRHPERRTGQDFFPSYLADKPGESK